MKDISKSLCDLKHIHYFFYYSGIFTLHLLPIYPAIMLSLGIFGKITILQSNRMIPFKSIICMIIFSYCYDLSTINIIYNLCLIPILLHVLLVLKIDYETENVFIDYLYGGYNYKKKYINMLINNL
jgi:hypothetical protein